MHILIHKTEDEYYGQDERKNEMLRKIKEIITEEIDSIKKTYKSSVEYHLTSIYDHSLYEAFSKII